MGIHGETTVAALYALFGADHAPTMPALKAEVEQRTKQLSRRGFLGIMGAATAGMMFSPNTGLWTPAPAEEAVRLASTDLGLLARRFALACDEVFPDWASRWRPRSTEAFDPSLMSAPARHISRGAVASAFDLDERALQSIARGTRPGETFGFNDAYPLPGLYVDADMAVAEALSPEQNLLVRVVEWSQPADMFRPDRGWQRVHDFEVAGYFTTSISKRGDSFKVGARARRRGRLPLEAM